MSLHSRYRTVALLAVTSLFAVFGAQSALSRTASAQTATVHRHVRRRHVPVKSVVVSSRTTGRTVSRTRTRAGVIHTNTAATLRAAGLRHRVRTRRVFYNPWSEPTYADSTIGDNVEGEDLAVRKAAVDALGPYNGTVVVADPQSGRVLSIVNQKLALKGAYQPCSTVKMVVSLASLKEQIIDPASSVRISRRTSMDMTRALAMSNNFYFAKLGEELGFDRVEKYGKLFGLGEKAGLDIPGEEAGYLAEQTPDSGIGMMTSFGDGIRLTPLELTSIVTTIANGGTMYYLQYPKSKEEADKFVPRIKRELEITDLVPAIKAGMMGAVEYGTARRASYSNMDETILGKTGTCTDTAQPGVHLGWFGSFNDFGNKKLVVVVLLTGGRGVSGPIASGIAGNVYHNLAQLNYFTPIPANQQEAATPLALVSLPPGNLP
ncbi:MAG TPA: penicillin-binding transpeptidase domain-containing protein [Bryobacteraceae bacterium]|nr:penicillin-binding transpeptidase domain-containing protein [Bryobacteraceae bacterium]